MMMMKKPTIVEMIPCWWYSVIGDDEVSEASESDDNDDGDTLVTFNDDGDSRVMFSDDGDSRVMFNDDGDSRVMLNFQWIRKFPIVIRG